MNAHPTWRTGLAMFAAVVRKEVRQTIRDRRLMALLLAAPAIQLVLFGFAVNLDVDRVPTVVVDLDQTHSSRQDQRALLADGTLRFLRATRDIHEAERALERGEAAVALVIPRHYERDLRSGRGASVQGIVDGSDANRAAVAGGAISSYYAQLSRGGRVSVNVQTRMLYNPGLGTAVYMVPGVAAILLLLITTIIASMGLAREREVGTLEQVLVTPVSSGVLIAGKILPFAVVGVIDLCVALVVGNVAFGMPIRGSIILILAATCLYLLTTLGIGLLISTTSRSQQQAFLGGVLFMLPAALLSGILTPVASMPDWLQPFTYLNPLRHYAHLLRGVLLRGARLEEMAEPVLILAVMGAAVFTVAPSVFDRA